jgi:hypothetical protein
MIEEINISVDALTKAKEGTILIRKNGKWIAVEPSKVQELVNLDKRIKDLEKLPADFKILTENNKHFKLYAKSHFLVIYQSFSIKVLTGDIELTEDQEIALEGIDSKVINGEISVEAALELHPYLKETFIKVFASSEIVEFPQV